MGILTCTKPDPKVAIVILNWNNWQKSLDCLNNLRTISYANTHIYVVDNGSVDGSIRQLREHSDIFTLISNDRNYGYTGGNNIAIKRAIAEDADYVWLVNNDAVVERDTLTALVAKAESDPRIGMVSPVLRRPLPYAGCEIAGVMFDLGAPCLHTTTDIEIAQRWQNTWPDRIALFGTALLLRRSLIDTVGLLDDNLFAYEEDIDLSIRSVKGGFRNVVEFSATVYHHDRPRVDDAGYYVAPYIYYFMTRNHNLLWRKHCDTKTAFKGAIWGFAHRLADLRDMERNGFQQGIDAILSGLWHGWRGIGGAYAPSRRMPLLLRMILRTSPALLQMGLNILSFASRLFHRRLLISTHKFRRTGQ